VCQSKLSCRYKSLALQAERARAVIFETLALHSNSIVKKRMRIIIYVLRSCWISKRLLIAPCHISFVSLDVVITTRNQKQRRENLENLCRLRQEETKYKCRKCASSPASSHALPLSSSTNSLARSVRHDVMVYWLSSLVLYGNGGKCHLVAIRKWHVCWCSPPRAWVAASSGAR
jgi:hypothetical protein